MVDFTTLYNEYESTKNVCKFCDDYKKDSAATRFLLVRSLNKKNLKEVITNYSTENNDGNIKELTEKAYYSNITIEQLVSYIESKRPELIRQREQELEGLQELLADLPVVNCGVRNDKVDNIVNSFVRNKSLKTKNALEEELNSTMQRIQQYIMWSYYNQTSNDIIELFFLKHPAVIPTLRKIHSIDFFLKIDGNIVPFDLKLTHISDKYFNLASQGISRADNDNSPDDFCIDQDSPSNELKTIKAYYRQLKQEHTEFNLPNLGKHDKNDLCELLISTKDSDASDFVTKMQNGHAKFVPSSPDELYPLEWWNFKYQEERLFCNNNRLFVFLAFRNKFVDGRELKGKTREIGNKITELLDNLSAENIHRVKYHYGKKASLEGNYTARAISTIYSE